MHCAVIAAALAVGALAVPHQKRDVVTDTDVNVVYVTDVVTVTGGEAPATTTAAPEAQHYGHGGKHTWAWTWTSEWTSEATSTEAPTTEAPPPAPTSTTTEAPPPAPTSTEETSTYETPSPTSTEQPSSTGMSGAVPTTYQEITLYHHNIHRQNHSAPAVEWNNTLETAAADVAASCIYAHNTDAGGGGYGQNIAAGVEGNNISAIITDLFYNGEINWFSGQYGKKQPDMTNFDSFGHFTQIVWKNSLTVACVTQDCTSQGLANVGTDVSAYFTVCNYFPPGNYDDEYNTNVGRPLGEPTAQWNTGL